MTKYVVGFLFNSITPDVGQKVVLIRKNKPDWQRGKLNGVGGKIEPGENAFNAMVREFEEETGQTFLGWHFVGGIVVKDQAFVHVYSGTDSNIVDNVKTLTDEEIFKVRTHELHTKPTLTNLDQWIPLSLSCEIINSLGKAWNAISIKE